ncbi:MAG: hypothetical protein E7474_06165 [Ruminococcaceae bacterium]|nr:hypothetical protein [Oscillospiraceae bacterium]
MSEVKTRRLEYDYAKGIGVLLVIMGHMTTYPRAIKNMIYSFHMPMFFIIAGLLISVPAKGEEGSFRKLLQKKSRAILIPAFFFELLMYVWGIVKRIIEHEFAVSWLPKGFLGIFLQIGYSEYSGSLWFLWTFFLALLAAYAILSLLEKTRYIYIYIIVTIMCLLAGQYMFSTAFPTLFLPWHIEVLPMCTAYVLVGVITKRAIEGSDCKWDVAWLIGAAAIWLGAFYLDYMPQGGGFAVDSHTFHNLILDTACAIAGSFGVIYLSKIIAGRSKKEWKLLSYMGKNSMIYYGVQAVMVGVLNTILWYFFDDLYNCKGVLLSLVSLSISVACDTIFCLFYQKFVNPMLNKVWARE